MFVIMRDAMTPSGLWHIGTMPVVWIRFARDQVSLLVLGVLSLGIVYLVQRLEPKLAKTVVWKKRKTGRAIGIGLLAGGLIGAPSVVFSIFVPAWLRGGAVQPALWPSLLFLAMAGNLLEEVLFRGYLQGFFERELGAKRAIWASGLAFAAAHGLLAAQVGGTGAIALIAFTAYEGLICAWVRNRDGVISSSLAHGIGLFLVASGIPAVV